MKYLKKMNNWNQVIDMFKQGYQLGLVQSFYHETLFKDPLLLVQFKKIQKKYTLIVPILLMFIIIALRK